MGMWTEICADSLKSLGCTVSTVCSNKTSLFPRLSAHLLYLIGGFSTKKKKNFLEKRIRQNLNQKLSANHYDLFLSIQGKVTREDILSLKKMNPRIKVIYWWGDILISAARMKIQNIHDVVDYLLISYRGDYQSLENEGIQNLYYFPFACSEKFHSQPPVDEDDLKKYASKVSFVGTFYPERGELIKFLNANLTEPVKVWGRSWNKCPEVASAGRLTMKETLKVHRSSDISLNIHHNRTNNGFNMKFYEIPAAGGFQIVDWQPELNNLKYGAVVCSFKNKDELLQKIQYFLKNEKERARLKTEGQKLILAENSYIKQFETLLKKVEEK